MSDYRMGFRECRQTERGIAAQRRAVIWRIVRVVVVVALLIAGLLAFWQLWPRTAFGSTMQPRAMLVVMNEKVLLSNCTTESETCR